MKRFARTIIDAHCGIIHHRQALLRYPRLALLEGAVSRVGAVPFGRVGGTRCATFAKLRSGGPIASPDDTGARDKGLRGGLFFAWLLTGTHLNGGIQSASVVIHRLASLCAVPAKETASDERACRL